MYRHLLNINYVRTYELKNKQTVFKIFLLDALVFKPMSEIMYLAEFDLKSTS